MITPKSSLCPSVDDSNRVALPNYIAYNHPSTKWLLNTFRNGANNRLVAMLKERPYLFRHIFQVHDSPSDVLTDPTDNRYLFNSSAILYLRPLSLAIYMRCKSAVKIMLGSKLCNPLEYSYASDVYVQIQGYNGGDIIEILPACIAIRRQFLEILPILFQRVPLSLSPSCSPRTSFVIRYVSRRIQRTTTYDDLFQYATDLAQTSRHINIVKLLDVLITQFPSFYCPGRLDEKKKSQTYSLYRRLAHITLYDDTEGRINFPLIQCMELLARNSHFRPNACSAGRHSTSSLLSLSFKDIHLTWNEMNEWTRDCYICVALTFHVFAIVMCKSKTGTISSARNLLFRVIHETKLLESTLALPIEILAEALESIMQHDNVGLDRLYEKRAAISQKHRPSIERGDADFTISRKSIDQKPYGLLSFKNSLKTLAHIVELLRNTNKLAHINQGHLKTVTRRSRVDSTHAFVPKYRLATGFRGSQSDKIGYSLKHHTQDRLYRSRKYKHYRGLHTVINTGERHATEPLTQKRGTIPTSYVSRMHNGDETKSGNSKHQLATPSSQQIRLTPTTLDTCETSLLHNICSDDHSSNRLVPSTDDVKVKVSTGDDFYDSRQLYSEPGIALVDESTEISDNFVKAFCGEDVRIMGTNSVQTLRTQSGSEDKRYRKSCQTHENECRKAVSALIVKKPSVENLSLRDVDHLIDCITSSALDNHRELDSQLIEDLFKEYMEQGIFPSRSISRANSSVGSRRHRDRDEDANTITAEIWSNTVEKNMVTPEGEHPSEHSEIHIQEQPDFVNPTQIAHSISPNLGNSKINIVFTSPQPSTDNSHGSPSELDTSTSYKRFLWSCAKPIAQINHAIGALKQHISAGRRSVVRLDPKPSPNLESNRTN